MVNEFLMSFKCVLYEPSEFRVFILNLCRIHHGTP